MSAIHVEGNISVNLIQDNEIGARNKSYRSIKEGQKKLIRLRNDLCDKFSLGRVNISCQAAILNFVRKDSYRTGLVHY